jgi:hypothetical protein
MAPSPPRAKFAEQFVADERARHARPCAGHPRLLLLKIKNVDGRVKPGHDANQPATSLSRLLSRELKRVQGRKPAQFGWRV